MNRSLEARMIDPVKSRTEKALAWLAKGTPDKPRTAYQAAKKFDLARSVLSRAIKARTGRARCPACGQLLPRRSR